MVVLQKWKAARDDLIDAIDAYLDTTIALESAIAKPWGHFSTDADLEEAIYVVHKKRKSVESRIEDLYDAEIYLDKIRNRSKQRVPINSLPLEILTSIFTLACSSGRPEDASLSFFGTPVRPTPKTLLALTRVCSDWRRIVTNIPSLWSHIDILMRDYIYDDDEAILNNTYLWLQRARTMPLSIHVSKRSHHRALPSPGWYSLFGHLQATTSLCIGPVRNQRFPDDVLTLWIASAKNSLVQTLAVLGADGARTKRMLLWGESFRPEKIDAFLAPIRVLRLHNTYFDWGSRAYHGLVELEMGFLQDSVCPSVEEMAAILLACPELRILRLQAMTAWNSERVYFEPVLLNHLEVLDLTGMRARGLEVFLPLITPGPGELSFRTNLAYDPEVEHAFQSFFSRSNVVRLFIQGAGADRDFIRGHITPLKNLRVLIFDLNLQADRRDGDDKLAALIDPQDSTGSTLCSSQWPQLRTLYLINGDINTERVRSVVESCRIQKLRIASCHMDRSDEEVEQWLQPVVEDVRCRLDVDRRMLVREWHKHMW
ncbi:hypothetical protein BDV93DRAFT_528944 [Ceratobasidium sp. AG-I]|nr:hypothetical protein BDV93DRAFT_528944 [Ceratobasidium sp. AG-I]